MGDPAIDLERHYDRLEDQDRTTQAAEGAVEDYLTGRNAEARVAELLGSEGACELLADILGVYVEHSGGAPGNRQRLENALVDASRGAYRAMVEAQERAWRERA